MYLRLLWQQMRYKNQSCEGFVKVIPTMVAGKNEVIQSFLQIIYLLT